MVGQNTAVSLTPDALGPTSNDWLGRSQFNDPLFKGTFDEFRIWSGAMTIGQVVASFNAGPEAPICGVCLTAIKSSGGKVTISWPSFAADYFLESSATLGPGAVWLGVTEPSLDDGEFIHVTLSVDQASLFFRLSR